MFPYGLGVDWTQADVVLDKLHAPSGIILGTKKEGCGALGYVYLNVNKALLYIFFISLHVYINDL